MSDLNYFEYPPPRSWEQFEELCADLFGAMWSDPGLVRHGRAGQAQFGVDIVAARGGIYPVGLQCKKKSRWPAQKLTAGDVDCEVEKAEKFRPILKEFYILTTAATDAPLQQHVRTLNELRRKERKFRVEILFWPEIVRRVAHFDRVARKHFPIGDKRDEFSPLLATWYTRGGKLELTNRDWHLAVGEVGEDFQEWPTGHIVVRQRESDVMMAKLQRMEKEPASLNHRASKLELRRKLRYMLEKERRVQETIRMLYTNKQLKLYMLDLDETGVDAEEILRAVVECELRQGLEGGAMDEKIRLFPPTPHLLSGPRSSNSLADGDLAIFLPSKEYAQILETERTFPRKFYGNQIVKVVSELPKSVRRRFAIPAIVTRIERIMLEDRKSLAEMEVAGYLSLNSWKYAS